MVTMAQARWEMRKVAQACLLAIHNDGKLADGVREALDERQRGVRGVTRDQLQRKP